MNWIQWNTDIFYAILFCIITSFCFYLPWKVFALSAKKHPAFVFICYRLIPLGFFCFTPFFFLYEALSYFSSVGYQFHRFYPGMVLLGSSKQNQVIRSLLFLWFIGMLVKSILYLKDTIFIRKLTNQLPLFSMYPTDLLNPELYSITLNLSQTLKLSKMPEIRYCAEAYTPMTVKTQNFIILLPLRQYSKMELSTILLHEMIHIKHNDLKKLHVGRILTIIFWFYPIAYLFYHNIELICETACDQKVLLYLNPQLSHTEYFSLILTHTQPPKRIPTCFGLNNKLQLKYRMTASRFLNYHKFRSTFCSLLVGLTILASSSVITQASLTPIEQIHNHWFDETTELIEVSYEPSVYTFYTTQEAPDYMENTFLPSLSRANIIDTRTAHGVNSYAYTLAPGEHVSVSYLYLTPENTVTIGGTYSPSDAKFRIGISNGTYRKYVYPSGGGYSPTFSISSSETYQIFIENTGAISFTVKGSYAF